VAGLRPIELSFASCYKSAENGSLDRARTTDNMSDLYFFNSSSADEARKALFEYEKRSLLILEHVFHRGYDVRQAFSQWFKELTGEQADPAFILHEEPLYLTAQYLGIDLATIDAGAWAQEYDRLAKKNHW
jgi:hypothetical protein